MLRSPPRLSEAAEGRSRGPGGRDELGDGKSRGEDLGFEIGDVLGVDQLVIDAGDRGSCQINSSAGTSGPK